MGQLGDELARTETVIKRGWQRNIGVEQFLAEVRDYLTPDPFHAVNAGEVTQHPQQADEKDDPGQPEAERRILADENPVDQGFHELDEGRLHAGIQGHAHHAHEEK